MENNIYKKNILDLTEQEIEALSTAREVLRDGNRLYGDGKDDVSHIEYAVGLALAALKELFDPLPDDSDAGINTVIEIGLDRAGWFVTFIMNEDEVLN